MAAWTGGYSRDGAKGSDSGHNLKVELIGFAEEPNVEYERKGKDGPRFVAYWPNGMTSPHYNRDYEDSVEILPNSYDKMVHEKS